jgi:hypothetical protein
MEVCLEAGGSWVLVAYLPTRHSPIPKSLVTRPDRSGFLGASRPTKVAYQTIVPYGHAEVGARGRW